MNQAETISSEIQRNSGFELSQLARQSQGQAVKTGDFYGGTQLSTDRWGAIQSSHS